MQHILNVNSVSFGMEKTAFFFLPTDQAFMLIVRGDLSNLSLYYLFFWRGDLK